MSVTTDILETKGAALKEGCAPEVFTYTVKDYLIGCVNFDIPIEAVVRICLDREVDMNEDAMATEKSVRDLCKADLYVWIVLGVSRRGNNSDSDNGWSHTVGGFTLTEKDKEYLLKAANAIYEENGEQTIGKTAVKIKSYGIKPADFDVSGVPQPHILR